jgi:hypothetical protein
MLTLTVVPIATQIRTAVYETIASPLQEVVTTKSVPLPSATPYITLNGPKDGSSFETKGQVEFSWNAFPGAADYRLDIIPSSKNAVKGVSVTTKELSKTQFIENYPWGGLFTWQVIALNAQGIPIGFSEKESFTKPILSGDLICIEQGPFIYWKDDGSVDCLKWECDGYKRGKDCYSE